MSEPALLCFNNANFKQSYTLKLFISFKMSYSCCFGCRENLDFPDFLLKSFISSTTQFGPTPFFYFEEEKGKNYTIRLLLI